MFYDIYLYTLCYYICCLLGACMRCTWLCSLKPGVTRRFPRSVATTPRSRGRATAGPLCGQAAASPGPRGGGTSKAGKQAAPLDVRVVMATHEAQGSSGITEGARCARRWSRVTSSDPARFGRLEWRHTYVLVSSTTSSDRCLLQFVFFFLIIVFYAYHMYYLR
jgi:hypothetical protein